MNIIVQKFGGTSLATRETRLFAVEHIVDAVNEGKKVVVVVSAMGRKGQPYSTDTLLSLFDSEDECSKRERDLLMSCGELISGVMLSAMLRGMNHDACVLNGAQAGIQTNGDYGNAHISTIHPQRILDELTLGRIVIVTGFQGATDEGEVTTLGRGGSDTTATALGVALNAECVDIFTDVDGIMTADPRIVEDAKHLRQVTYAEICNFAYQGAKVIHPRAVEIAMQKNIPIRVRSTMSKDPGTLVTNQSEMDRIEHQSVHDRMVTGITQSSNVVQIKIVDQLKHGGQLRIFKAMADHEISVDFISVTPEGTAYTVSHDNAERARSLLSEMGIHPQITYDCAKVSAVGAGIAGVPGVMALIVEALSDEEIEILQSADSHTTIWCLVNGKDMGKAVRALHAKFRLHV